MQGHASGVDLAHEDKRFFVPPHIGESARCIVLSVDDQVVVRIIALNQSQAGRDNRKRFSVSPVLVKSQ